MVKKDFSLPKTLNFSAGIVGIGTYSPEKILTNQDLKKIVDTSDEWITTKTGIKERRIASSEQATSDLAFLAGEKALKNAGIKPEEVDLIIVATATPDMMFPATACIVQEKLGLVNAAAFDLEAGCTGFIYALTVGSQFIAGGMYKTVLVIGAETLSRILNWEDRTTCVLFGDGAGAVVLRPVPANRGIIGYHLGADGSGSSTLTMPAGGSRMPTTRDTADEKLHTVHMQGHEVYKFATRIVVDATKKVLEQANLTISDIDLLIPHQANVRIIESSAKKLGLPMEKIMVNIDRYGNTSSASIPLALAEALELERIKEGDNIVLVGFGSGLTFGAVVMKWLCQSQRDSGP